MKKLICMFLTIALLITLVACGASSSNSGSNGSFNNFGGNESSEIGVYILEKMVEFDGTTYSGAEMKEEGVVYKIEITAPGRAVMYVDGDDRNTGTYQDDLYYNEDTCWYTEDSETMIVGSFNLNGNLLTITDEDSNTFYFRKN